MIRIININSEIGAGTRGASLGFDALRIASLNSQSEVFRKYPAIHLDNENNLLYEVNETPRAKRVEGIVKIYERLIDAIGNTIEVGYFPLVIAGDHSTAGGTISGLKCANPDSRIGVIWIDAHADLHSPYTTPSGNVHGMPLAAVLAIDNLEKQRSAIEFETKDQWNQLKSVGDIEPKIHPEDVVFVGLRSTEDEENHIITHNHIKVFGVDDVRINGGLDIADKAMAHLRHCDLIYVSFDVDVMDPSISRGTGTPVPDGLMVAECDEIINRLLADEKVQAFEIVEINPLLDERNKMARTVTQILDNVIMTLERRFFR